MSNTAEKMDQLVNGVNTGRIIELATQMSQDDNYGNFRFRAHNTWLNGTRSRTAFKDFYAGNRERTERGPSIQTSQNSCQEKTLRLTRLNTTLTLWLAA